VLTHPATKPQAVVDSGALDSLVACLEEFDPGVKESAAWAMGYIAGHNAELAGTVVDSGAVALLVLCVQVRVCAVVTRACVTQQTPGSHDLHNSVTTSLVHDLACNGPHPRVEKERGGTARRPERAERRTRRRLRAQ